MDGGDTRRVHGGCLSRLRPLWERAARYFSAEELVRGLFARDLSRGIVEMQGRLRDRSNLRIASGSIRATLVRVPYAAQREAQHSVHLPRTGTDLRCKFDETIVAVTGDLPGVRAQCFKC